MNRILSFIGIIILLFSCSKPNEELVQKEDKLKLIETSETIEIDYQKNQIPILFETNQSWTASSSVKWISLNTSKGTASDVEIMAIVEQNTTKEPRIGEITIQAGKLSKSVTITQKPEDSKTEKETLTINVTNIQYTSFLVSIKTNTNKLFYWDVIEKAIWDSYGGDAVWEAYINSYKEDGILSQALLSSDSSYHYEDQEAQTDYIVFAAFCDKDGNKIGEFFTKEFNTDSDLTNDDLAPISFSISGANENSFTLQTSTTSSVAYYCNVVDKATWDSKGPDYVWSSQVEKLVYDGTFSNALTIGSNSKKYDNMTSQQYIAYAAYCHDNGNLRSSIFSKEIDLSEFGSLSKVSEVIINTDVALTPGNSYMVTAECYDANFKHIKDAIVSWKSSNTSVATVDKDGNIKAIKQGQATITASVQSGTASDECTVYVVNDFSAPVDMGLSIKWAQCNIGASAPYKQGRYYYWGGKASKSTEELIWSHVPFNHGSPSYNLTFFEDIMGSVIDNNNLLLSDDTAHLLSGGNWRMPTKQECEELVQNCTLEKIKLNNVLGIMCKSKKSGYSDKWLFFWSCQSESESYDKSESYWTSTINPNQEYYCNTYYKAYSQSYVMQINRTPERPYSDYINVESIERHWLSLVRPVYSEKTPDYLDITVSNTTYSSCVVSVSTNLTNQYRYGFVKKSTWDSAKRDPSQFNGKTYTGNVKLQYTSLETHGDYVFYACPLNSNGEIIDCYYKYIWTYNINY